MMTAVDVDQLVPRARFRPSDLPGVRDRIIADLDTGAIGTAILACILRGQQGIRPTTTATSPDRTAQMMVELERERVTSANLFYVAPDMTALAVAAGATLPDYTFHVTDLPAPYGLLLFDGPIVEVYPEPWHVAGVDVDSHLTAVAWGPITLRDRAGVWFSLYGDRDLDYDAAVRVGAMTLDEARTARPTAGRLIYDNECLIFDGAPWSDVMDDNGPTTAAVDSDVVSLRQGGARVGPVLIRTLLAASTLMRQPLITETVDARTVYDRPERRRAARAGHADTPVTLIHLRQHERHPTAGEHRDVDWSCRWPVVGYWRQQPYGPGGQLRRPVYIPPMIKGPKDKPLRLGDRVKVWDR